MPPQITYSSDERSDRGDLSELRVPIRQEKSESVKQEANGRSQSPEKEEDALMIGAEDEDEDGDDEENLGEDVYVVEKIISHLVDEDVTGEIKYEVKWEGFSKKSDRTWEPEENLVTATLVLNEYLTSIGGKEAIIQAYEEQKSQLVVGKGKKRSRASTGNGTIAKKGRKSHPASSTPPVSARSDFKPPTGSWEEEVIGIDACEGTDNEVVVYLTWKGNHKTQHPLNQVYKRCPQRMLKFYESHLVFKKTELPTGDEDEDD